MKKERLLLESPLVNIRFNYGYYFTQLMTKHFKVQDKVNGDKITIPKEMLYMPDGGTGESIAVIVYD